ncbi:MAG: phage tail assembly chaperone [Hyphomicrobiaceae bacterium]
MAAGFGILRLSPATLWSMTPREFAAAVGWLTPAEARPSRSDLSQLMTRFPDSRSPPP